MRQDSEGHIEWEREWRHFNFLADDQPNGGLFIHFYGDFGGGGRDCRVWTVEWQPVLERIPVMSKTLPSAVMAEHSASKDARERADVPATSIVTALCLNNRDRRDKPGDDGSL